MNTFWLRGAKTKEDKEKLKQKVFADRWALDRLTVWAKEKLASIDNVREDDYNCPSWVARQAHRNGYNQAMRDLIHLTQLNKEDHPND